jgi:hypothetical protein
MSTLELENIKHPDNSGDNIALASNGSITIDRKSTDGTIAEFRKDGTTVGSIGTFANDVYMGQDDTGIRYGYAGINTLIPFDVNSVGTTDGSSDGVTDLGHSARRFKDLHLSGGVYLGGTGTANKLDDYEEGTWTLTQGAQGTWNSPTFVCKYTKIGQLVTVTIEQNAGTISYSKTYYGGLPFPVNSSTHGYKGVGSASNGGLDDLGGIMAFSGTTQIYVLTSGSNQTNLIFSITYHTDS